jgi:hypothetical protein
MNGRPAAGADEEDADASPRTVMRRTLRDVFYLASFVCRGIKDLDAELTALGEAHGLDVGAQRERAAEAMDAADTMYSCAKGCDAALNLGAEREVFEEVRTRLRALGLPGTRESNPTA